MISILKCLFQHYTVLVKSKSSITSNPLLYWNLGTVAGTFMAVIPVEI